MCRREGSLEENGLEVYLTAASAGGCQNRGWLCGHPYAKRGARESLSLGRKQSKHPQPRNPRHHLRPNSCMVVYEYLGPHI